MEDKTIQTKYKKNIAQVVVLVIAITIITLAAGTSYAILNGTALSENEQLIRAGNVTLRLTEHFDNIDGGVRIMEDPDGLLLGTTYDFTIKNVGTVGAEYKLKLENDVPNNYSGDVLSTNYFKVGLEINGKEYGPMGLQDVNNIIDKNTLAVNEVNAYKLRVWLDKSQESALEGKEDYNAFLKLKVEAKQNTTIKGNYVYSFDTDADGGYNYSPLDAGTYTGYCSVWTDGQNSYNSCTDSFPSYGFLTQSTCETQINNWGGANEGYSCEPGTWTTSGVAYTTDASTLNQDYYIKYNIGLQKEPLESYVCYILNDTEYCLKGGDGVWDSTNVVSVSPSYNDNKDILDESFGSSNCTETNNSTYSHYDCSMGSWESGADSRGITFVSYGNGGCSVDANSYSTCALLSVLPGPGPGPSGGNADS